MILKPKKVVFSTPRRNISGALIGLERGMLYYKVRYLCFMTTFFGFGYPELTLI
jgi:hypothetical protein